MVYPLNYIGMSGYSFFIKRSHPAGSSDAKARDSSTPFKGQWSEMGFWLKQSLLVALDRKYLEVFFNFAHF
jgi:hypothetical protein